MSQSRQLAAIMFTDIVGYTALMDEDEQRAFELLKKNRQVQRPLIEKYNGKWLKEMGDGVLASFSTVTDAVFCAAAIQKTCEEEPDLKLRIGIHQGEVVFDGEDVFGSGVNIASRLEPLAPIGGILVSESVHRNLGNKKGIASSFLREEQLKNVKEPIKIFSVRVEGVDPLVMAEKSAIASSYRSNPSGRNPSGRNKVILGVTAVILILLGYLFYNNNSSKGKITENPTHPEMSDNSIAVIPFKTITEDSTSRYIAEGVREAILNNLFKIKELQVGSRTSAEAYRNSTKRIPEIASELGVSTILEGSAQKFGDRIRITAQLIDGKTDNHLWSEEYDRDWGDIFVIYTEIAEKVAAALQVVITPKEKQQIATTPTSNVTAYDYILQAREEQKKHWFYYDTIALKKAETLYNQALAIDPLYAPGWEKLGSIYWDRNGTKDYFEKSYLDSVLWYCNKAEALDPKEAEAYLLRGMVFHKRGNIDLAIEYYEQALELTGNDSAILTSAVIRGTLWRLGYIYIFKKDYIKGFSLIRKAVQKAKGSPQDYRHMIKRLGEAYLFIGAYEEGRNYIMKSKSLGGNVNSLCAIPAYQGNIPFSNDCLSTNCPTDSTDNFCNYLQANNLLQLREFESSVKHFRKIRKRNEELGRVDWSNLYREGFALMKRGYQEQGMNLIEEQLSQLEKRKKLRRSDGHDYHLAAIYASRGDKKRALQYLQDYRESIIFLPPSENLIPLSFIQHDIMFENLWDNEEFQAIVKSDQEEKKEARAQLKEMEELGSNRLIEQ